MKKVITKSEVFNSSIGDPYGIVFPETTHNERRLMLAELFEQLLVFDRITISTNRLNVALTVLIDEIGLELTEKLMDRGYIKIMIWSPLIVTSIGKQKDDGTIDESVIYGQPPIAAGTYSDDDLDPEKNVYQALNNFDFADSHLQCIKLADSHLQCIKLISGEVSRT